MSLMRGVGGILRAGGALARFAQACVDKCCKKWYCHTDYSCDNDPAGALGQYDDLATCMRACVEKPKWYCHSDYSCDNEPIDALGIYDTAEECYDNCLKDYGIYCCYKSYDFSKGSECVRSECADPGLTRSGPYEDDALCKAGCGDKYYCVASKTDPNGYECVTTIVGYTPIAGPFITVEQCTDACDPLKIKYWCIDNKKCQVTAEEGPPFECSFGAFCEEYDTFNDCIVNCMREKWYCGTLGDECQQLPDPPFPGAQGYGSKSACDEECDNYYCCWVSQGAPEMGSYCQKAECDPGFERSGPHDGSAACARECEKIKCWSYNDPDTPYRTLKVCQEDAPQGEDVREVSGPYGTEAECKRVCDKPIYKWYCENDGTGKKCKKCCAGGNCADDDEPCQGGVTFYETEKLCKEACNPPPSYRWFCDRGRCRRCVASGEVKPGDVRCPAGLPLYEDPNACGEECKEPVYRWWCKNGECKFCLLDGNGAPGDVLCSAVLTDTFFINETTCKQVCSAGNGWVCANGECLPCWNDMAPNTPPNPGGMPNCSELPNQGFAYTGLRLCQEACYYERPCWVAVSGGSCIETLVTVSEAFPECPDGTPSGTSNTEAECLGAVSPRSDDENPLP
jgi:hypothetical protein